MVISGHSSFKNLVPVYITLAFSVITPPEYVLPLFYVGVLGTKGSIQPWGAADAAATGPPWRALLAGINITARDALRRL